MSDIGRSLHVNWSELACKDGTSYPSKFILDGRVIELVVMFERIRAIWHKSLVINSAYRTVTYNKKVGGAAESQHLEGRALDLKPPKDVNIELFYGILKARHLELGIKGIGLYKTFIHVDIRDSVNLVSWESLK